MRSPTRWHAEAAGAKRAVRIGNTIITKGPIDVFLFLHSGPVRLWIPKELHFVDAVADPRFGVQCPLF